MDFRRKDIRLSSSRYIGQNSYFITFCCAAKRPIFADPQAATWLIEKLRKSSDSHHFAVCAYCVMPDHFHALVSGFTPDSDLIAFVTTLKQETGHAYRQKTSRHLWQTRFYDRILRAGEPADAVAGYIWMNPVRRGLCAHPNDYPHSGSFTTDWTKGFSISDAWTPEWKAGNRIERARPLINSDRPSR